MARTLRPANQGGGRLQQSSTAPPLDWSKMVVREMTPETRAISAANVQRAKERAGLGTPELQAAHHADIQQHVPRMAAWIQRSDELGNASGHSSTKPGGVWPYPNTQPYRQGTHHR